MSRQTAITAAAVAAMLHLATTSSVSGREFEDKFGRILNAELVAHEGSDSNTVTIERSDGKQLNVAIAIFSEKDQAFIRKWMQTTPPSLKGRFGSLADGLLLRHEFETFDGMDVPDASGTEALPSTLNFPVQSTTGVIGKALVFDGVDDSLYVNSPVVEDRTTVSFSLWFKTKEMRTRGEVWKRPTLLGVVANGGHSGDLTLYTSRGYLGTFHELPGPTRQTTKEFVADDKWHHVALVVHPIDGVRTFLDGRLVSTLDPPTRAIARRKLRVGSSNYHTEPNRWHQAAIDEFMVWERALTEGEVRELYLLRYRKSS